MPAFKKSHFPQLSTAGISGVLSIGALVGVAAPARAQVVSAAEEPSLGAAMVAVAAPATEPADSASTPALPGSGRDEMRGASRGPNWLGGRGAQPTAADIPDGAEWKQISTFMIDHSPHRWAFYNSLHEGPRQQGMMRYATKAFRALQKAQADDPALSAVIVQRIEAEDAVFGVVMDIRQARHAGDADKVKSFTPELTTKVAALVDIGLKERQLRVDALQKTLDDLKTRLAADQKNRDSVIADRVQNLSSPHVGPAGVGDASPIAPPGRFAPPVAVGMTTTPTP